MKKLITNISDCFECHHLGVGRSYKKIWCYYDEDNPRELIVDIDILQNEIDIPTWCPLEDSDA